MDTLTVPGGVFFHDEQGVIRNKGNLFKPDGTLAFDAKEVKLLELFGDGFIAYNCSESCGYVGIDGTVIIKLVAP